MKDKVAIIFCTIILFTGCASTDDIARIQNQVSDIHFRVYKLEKEIVDAKSNAKEALAQAEFARIAADKAAASAQDTNEKINRLFEQLQRK